MSSQTKTPIPATILTGFLGAGKTTLLNFILEQKHGYKFGIIVNEVGAIGIDGQLVERATDEIVQMNNGCVCCTVRKDLVKGIQQLIKRGGFDYLLIETTGIADPGPVAQTFMNIPQLQQFVRLDSIITVVDSEQIHKQMSETETAREQIAMADFVLLNKTDLVAPAQLDALEEEIRELNPHTSIFRTNQSQVNLKQLLDMNAFDVDHKLTVDPEFLNEYKEGRHHDDIVSHAFEFDQPFEVEKLENFIQKLSEEEKVFRSKGIVWMAQNPRRAVFHGVNNRFTIYWDRLWSKDEARKSQLVFIGKDLDKAKIQKQLADCLTAK